MKRRYILLIISLVLVVSVTYFLKPNAENEFIKKTQQEVKVMHSGIDSIFITADETMTDLESERNENKFILDSLDTQLVRKNHTVNNHITSLNKIEKLNSILKNKNKQLDSTIKELNTLRSSESEQFMNEIEYYINREVKLVIFYKHKIDSLTKENIILNNASSDTIYKVDTIYKLDTIYYTKNSIKKIVLRNNKN